MSILVISGIIEKSSHETIVMLVLQMNKRIWFEKIWYKTLNFKSSAS